MEQIKVKGIVLKAVDYKDSDKIVTIFSAEMGLINARLKGVKKNKAKLAFAVQPFAFIEFVLIKNGDFFTCVNATSIDQFFNITLDFDNYIFMLACLEICLKTVKQDDAQPELFLLLLNSLKLVCYDGVNSMSVFIKFVLESLSILGFYFEIDNCPICGERNSTKFHGFSYDFNGIICERCGYDYDYLELGQGEHAILRIINFSSLEDLYKIKFQSREDLISVISLLVKDFRILTGYEINSIEKFLV